MKHIITKDYDIIGIQREYKNKNGTMIIGICMFPCIDEEFPRKENYSRTVYMRTRKKKMLRFDIFDKSILPFKQQAKQWFKNMNEKDKQNFGLFEDLVTSEIDGLDEMELWLCMI